MDLNEMLIITPKSLIEKIDRLEYKMDMLLSNKGGGGMKLINGEEYVNEERAAEMLDIARPTLSSWKSRGLISYYKPEWSNKSFYKVKDIIEIQTGVKHSSNKEIEAEAKSHILKNKNKPPR